MTTSRDGYVFEHVVLPLQPQLKRFAWRLTRNKSYVDDLVQDTLTSALTSWPNWEPSTASVVVSAKKWLMTILGNKFMSLTRSGNYKTLRDTELMLNQNAETRHTRSDGDVFKLGNCFDVEHLTRAKYVDFSKYRNDVHMRGPDSGFGDEIEQALARVPEDQRAVVRMYYADDMTTREIAQELGITRSTASTRLMRGIEKIRPMLAYYAREEYGIQAT